MLLSSNTERLAQMIEAHQSTSAWLELQADLGRANFHLVLLCDTKSAPYGTWEYSLTGKGLIRQYFPSPLAAQNGAAHKVEDATVTQLAHAVAVSSEFCCPESFMFHLMTLDTSVACARPHLEVSYT